MRRAALLAVLCVPVLAATVMSAACGGSDASPAGPDASAADATQQTDTSTPPADGSGGTGDASDAGDMGDASDAGSAGDTGIGDGGAGDGHALDAAPFDYCTHVFGGPVTAFARCCAAELDAGRNAQDLAELREVQDSCNATYATGAAAGRIAPSTNRAACLAAGDAVGGGSCLDIRTALASVFDPDGPVAATCQGAYVGTQDLNAPCFLPEECKPGLACVGYVVPGIAGIAYQPQEGKCATPPGVGQPCGAAKADAGTFTFTVSVPPLFAAHPECVTGAYCNDGTCTARTANGDPCRGSEECIEGTRCYLGVCTTAGPSGDGGVCHNPNDCAYPLSCPLTFLTNDAGAACIYPGAAGATCTRNRDCQGTCVIAGDASTGTCASNCGSR